MGAPNVVRSQEDNLELMTLNQLVAKARSLREEAGLQPFTIRPEKASGDNFIGYDDELLLEWLDRDHEKGAPLAKKIRAKKEQRWKELGVEKAQLDKEAEELSTKLAAIIVRRRQIESVLPKGNKSMMDTTKGKKF